MNRTSLRRGLAPSVAALALGLTFSACAAGNAAEGTPASGDDSASGASGTLAGGGASSQEKAQAAWRAGYQTANPDVDVTYDPVGSGDGRKNFASGAYAFAGSDSYMDDDELAGAKERCGGTDPIEVPAYVSPIAVIYNLDGVDDLQLDSSTIARIFLGDITTWDDPAIAELNPDADLPDTTIAPVHRADESGTTANFTDYLAQTAPDDWTAEPDSVWPVTSGESAEGTSGLVGAVTDGSGTIGYADESAAADLSHVSIKVGDEYVEPSAEGAAKVVSISQRVEGRPDVDMALDIDRTTTEADAYPLLLASYLIACQTYEDADQAELVKGFLTYALSEEGQQAAADEAGSAPLESSLETEALAIVDKIAAQ